MGEWIDAGGKVPDLPSDTWVQALGRYGDVYGPLPVEMFDPEAWAGNMFCASHDIHAYRIVDRA